MKTDFTIREVADRLNVSLNTLRKWDKEGILKSKRSDEKSHRVYPAAALEEFLIMADHFKLAKKWTAAIKRQAPDVLFYCELSFTFQARLTKLQNDLGREKELADYYPLLVAIAGEIGNNSFDHNLGNWPDVPGVFFAYNIKRREIVLADRGRGVLATLKKVKPELKNEAEALRVAFTEILSGRSPESRGNGLKLVRNIVTQYPISVLFQSGDAILELKPRNSYLKIKAAAKPINGTLALIKF